MLLTSDHQPVRAWLNFLPARTWRNRILRNKTLGILMTSSLLSGCLEVPKNILASNSQSAMAASCQHPSALSAAALPSRFSLLIWNIYKQQGDWQPELDHWLDAPERASTIPVSTIPVNLSSVNLSSANPAPVNISATNTHNSNIDLLVLQEAKASPELKSWLQQRQFHWFQVAAFNWQDTSNGVLTASQVQVTRACGKRLSEPATRIPKSLLFSYYPLQGSAQQLLLVNLHAVNFSLRGRTYNEQLALISAEISDYPGPVIVAGDFNSWNARRSGFLVRWAAKEQLSAAIPSPDVRSRFLGYPLDGVYYRGLTLEQASSMTSEASDHSAMQMRFSVPERP